jgi:electron transfer flavoprotein beta subunit
VKIVVCIKQVPDTEARIKIGPDKRSIDPTDVNFVLNPYDEFAVEEALRIKEKGNEGEVTLICIGPERSTSAIRTALAMGADKAVFLKTEETDIDSFAAARALADVLKDMEYDLILFGKEAVDDGNQQVGPMVAELLNLPCVTVVTKLDITDDKVVAEREVEGGLEVVEATLPVVITAQKGLNEPRYPSLRGIMMAKKKPIEEREAALVESKLKILSMEYPPARKAGKIVGEGKEAVPELVRLLRGEAKVI